jgi:outer membrane protein assembly factor BamD (BamD/ComL family)
MAVTPRFWYAFLTQAPKEATEEEKKKAEELKNEGNNLLKDGKHQEAIDAYSKYVKRTPHLRVL